uniref:Zinc finger protein 883-like n=1 Tax=Erpetoichthys calabaricus TaxID=27687 RepID=A0A8C4TKJ9_ERPCA
MSTSSAEPEPDAEQFGDEPIDLTIKTSEPTLVYLQKNIPMREEQQTFNNKPPCSAQQDLEKFSFTGRAVLRGGMYYCSMCNRGFSTHRALRVHQQRHGDVPYRCGECGKQFNHYSTYYLHQEADACRRTFDCSDCGRSFRDITYFKNHQKSHKGQSPFWCQICGKNFAKAAHLKSHQKTHNTQCLYNCKDCGKVLQHISELGQHRCRKTPEDLFYKCPDCEASFGSLANLVSHQQEIHHSSIQQPYHCNNCGERFTDSETLIQHQKTHKMKRHTCGECGKRFSYFANYYIHQQLHRGKPELVHYRCTLCDKTFWDIKEFHEHQKDHKLVDGENDDREVGLEGTICRKKNTISTKYEKPCLDLSERPEKNKVKRKEDSKRSEEESSHLEIKEKEVKAGVEVEEGQHRCSFCGLRFKKKCHLDDHLLFHSGQKPYVCTECGKIFSHYPYFKSHMAVHQGAKPFECPDCGKVFCVISQLNRHVRIHTGEKPYHCKVCGKSFGDSTNCKRHQRSHLKEKPLTLAEMLLRDGIKKSTVSIGPAPKRGRPSRSKVKESVVEMARSQSCQILSMKDSCYLCMECGSSFQNESNLHNHYMQHARGDL